jgi:hypothetical protein
MSTAMLIVVRVGDPRIIHSDTNLECIAAVDASE